MNGEKTGNRRASYLIAAAVIALLVLVGAAFVAITAVRGNETDGDDLGPDAPAPELVVGLVGAAGPGVGPLR